MQGRRQIGVGEQRSSGRSATAAAYNRTASAGSGFGSFSAFRRPSITQTQKSRGNRRLATCNTAVALGTSSASTSICERSTRLFTGCFSSACASAARASSAGSASAVGRSIDRALRCARCRDRRPAPPQPAAPGVDFQSGSPHATPLVDRRGDLGRLRPTGQSRSGGLGINHIEIQTVTREKPPPARDQGAKIQGDRRVRRLLSADRPAAFARPGRRGRPPLFEARPRPGEAAACRTTQRRDRPALATATT